MDTRDFSQATIDEIYDIIEELKDQGSLGDSLHDYWCISEPDAVELSTYAAKGDLETYYQRHADKMDLTKKKFRKIVENVRQVDYEYQKIFTECNEELKNFKETLKNLAEEISIKTVSLDTDSYKRAMEVLEGDDEAKKQRLKELIGVKPGESRESRMNLQIQEILKYSMGSGGFEDEIDLESTEASVSQKKKLIQEIENIKEQFRKGKLTQEEVIDRICELYRIEDYGSKINYSLAVKKYQPEKKARIVSDILSTVMYIVEEDAIDTEQIEEISQTVKAKSYISDEMWSMAESAFRGAVAGVNAAVAGNYYAGVEGGKGGSNTGLAQYGDDFGKMGTYVENPNIKVDWSQYAEHGFERMQQRGMTQEMVDKIVSNGKVLSQNNGSKFACITKEGVAVVSKDGKIITTWSSDYYDSAMQEIIIKLFGE